MQGIHKRAKDEKVSFWTSIGLFKRVLLYEGVTADPYEVFADCSAHQELLHSGVSRIYLQEWVELQGWQKCSIRVMYFATQF